VAGRKSNKIVSDSRRKNMKALYIGQTNYGSKSRRMIKLCDLHRTTERLPDSEVEIQ